MDIHLTEQIRKFIFDPTIGKIVATFASLLIIFVMNKSLKRYLGTRVSDSSTRYRLKKMVSFLAFIIFAFSIGIIFSDKLGTLTVAFGVAGAGITFALQEVIASIAGWFVINFNNFFKVGDRVKLAGIKGDVIDISILRTTIMEIGDWVNGDLYNGRTVRISNSFVFKDPVFNYSAEYPFVWDEIQITIRPESDEEEAERIIDECANTVVGEYEKQSKQDWGHMVQKFMIEDARVDHFISMSVDGNGVSFTLRYITDFKSRRSTKDQLFRLINKAFKSTSNRVEWSVSTLELSSRPAIEIKESVSK